MNGHRRGGRGLADITGTCEGAEQIKSFGQIHVVADGFSEVGFGIGQLCEIERTLKIEVMDGFPRLQIAGERRFSDLVGAGKGDQQGQGRRI